MSVASDFRIETDPLSSGTIALAEIELRETPERVKEATQRLRELMHADKTLFFRDDDEFLLIFLRPCKFYPESAIAMMRRIAEFKKTHADILDGLMPIHEKDALLNSNIVNILKNRDHKGRRVLIVNVGGSWDPKAVNTDQIFRLFYLIHEAAMLEPETQVRGVVVLMDFEGMGRSQATSFSPSFSKKLITFIQEAMPLRLKEVHFVKESFLFNIVWQFFKPFVNAKLRNRMHFHGSKMASLHKHLNPSHLPANYGGSLPAIDYSGAEWFPVVQQHLDHIEAWNSYGFAKTNPEQQ